MELNVKSTGQFGNIFLLFAIWEYMQQISVNHPKATLIII